MQQLTWNQDGLIPVITQQYDSKQVLMHAWMNKQALDLTIKTGWVTYWSRSRQVLWQKGESSGNQQTLIELRVDCDGDTLLCMVNQQGAACHTGREHCFYYALSPKASEFVVTQSRPTDHKPT
ncbi:MAG: phosphoribosyl-AMP cyclohydrolase [Pontibacterium sp.]